MLSNLYQDPAVVAGTPFRCFIERLRPNFFVEPPRSKHVVQLGVGSGRSVSRLVVLGRHIQEVLGQVLGYGISPTPGRVLWPQVIQLKVLNSPEPSGPMS